MPLGQKWVLSPLPPASAKEMHSSENNTETENSSRTEETSRPRSCSERAEFGKAFSTLLLAEMDTFLLVKRIV